MQYFKGSFHCYWCAVRVLPDLYQGDSWNVCPGDFFPSFFPINVKEIKREMKASYLSNIRNVFIQDKFTFFSRVHFLPLLEWGLLHLRLFAL